MLVLEIMLENQRAAFARIEDRLEVVGSLALTQERHGATIAGMQRWQTGIQHDMEELESRIAKRDEKREEERQEEARQLATEARMWRRVQAPTLVIAAAGLATTLVTVLS